jgi:uncharacterized membrane protein
MHGGCDQGFCLLYAKLSYRRKFIRTVWMAIVGILLASSVFIARPQTRTPFALTFFVILIVIVVAQAVYNYRRWKAETA